MKKSIIILLLILFPLNLSISKDKNSFLKSFSKFNLTKEVKKDVKLIRKNGDVFNLKNDVLVGKSGKEESSFLNSISQRHNKNVEYTDLEGNTFKAKNLKQILLMKLKNESLKDYMKLFPNPIQEKATLILNSSQNSNVSIVLYKKNGFFHSKLYHGETQKGTNKIIIDFEKITKGKYVLVAISDHTTLTENITINE